MPENINQLRDWQSPAHLAAMDAVDPQTHRGAMRHFASPVTVVTSRKDGDPVGLTATAVCSVTADPPRIVVFINKQTLADSAIMAAGANWSPARRCSTARWSRSTAA